MSRSQWKIPYVNYSLIKSITKLKNKKIPIKTTSRSSIILPSFVGMNFKVHSGKSYRLINITPDRIGYKLGEFCFTRKMGEIHKKNKDKGKMLSPLKNKKIKK